MGITYGQALELAKQEASRLAQAPRNQIVNALELSDAWVFDYGDPAETDFPCGQQGIEVSKQNGTVSSFILPDERNFDRLNIAKKITYDESFDVEKVLQDMDDFLRDQNSEN